MTFSLPTQKRLLDHVLFPRKPGYDYNARGDQAWADIAENRAAVDDVVARIDRLDERITAGEEWVAENQQHEMYLEALAQLNALRNDQRALAINLASLRRVIWHQCCVLYACLYHGDRERWLQRHGVTFDGAGPAGIWEAVFPGEEPPGAWPEEVSERYIERSVNYTGWTLKTEES